MDLRDVYIGDLDDPKFDWENFNAAYNLPPRLGPNFPFPTPFWELINNISPDKFDGKQTDWGGWVARVNKKQMNQFVSDHYKNYVSKSDYSYLKEYDSLKSFIKSLDPNKKYALVAYEH